MENNFAAITLINQISSKLGPITSRCIFHTYLLTFSQGNSFYWEFLDAYEWALGIRSHNCLFFCFFMLPRFDLFGDLATELTLKLRVCSPTLQISQHCRFHSIGASQLLFIQCPESSLTLVCSNTYNENALSWVT